MATSPDPGLDALLASLKEHAARPAPPPAAAPSAPARTGPRRCPTCGRPLPRPPRPPMTADHLLVMLSLGLNAVVLVVLAYLVLRGLP